MLATLMVTFAWLLQTPPAIPQEPASAQTVERTAPPKEQYQARAMSYPNLRRLRDPRRDLRLVLLPFAADDGVDPDLANLYMTLVSAEVTEIPGTAVAYAAHFDPTSSCAADFACMAEKLPYADVAITGIVAQKAGEGLMILHVIDLKGHTLAFAADIEGVAAHEDVLKQVLKNLHDTL